MSELAQVLDELIDGTSFDSQGELARYLAQGLAKRFSFEPILSPEQLRLNAAEAVILDAMANWDADNRRELDRLIVAARAVFAVRDHLGEVDGMVELIAHRFDFNRRSEPWRALHTLIRNGAV